MNVLSLINSSLEIGYCSTTLSNHCIIRFIIFVSRFHPELWNGFYQLSTFNTPNQWLNVQSYCSAGKIWKTKRGLIVYETLLRLVLISIGYVSPHANSFYSTFPPNQLLDKCNIDIAGSSSECMEATLYKWWNWYCILSIEHTHEFLGITLLSKGRKHILHISNNGKEHGLHSAATCPPHVTGFCRRHPRTRWTKHLRQQS